MCTYILYIHTHRQTWSSSSWSLSCLWHVLQPPLFPGFGLLVRSSARCPNLLFVWCLVFPLFPILSFPLRHRNILEHSYWLSECWQQKLSVDVEKFECSAHFLPDTRNKEWVLVRWKIYEACMQYLILLSEGVRAKNAVRSLCGLFRPCWRWQCEMEEVQYMLCLRHVTTWNEGKGDVGKKDECLPKVKSCSVIWDPSQPDRVAVVDIRLMWLGVAVWSSAPGGFWKVLGFSVPLEWP